MNPMREVHAQEARDGFRDLLDEVRGGEHITITRYNRAEAIMVPVDWYRKQTGEKQEQEQEG
jgi:prevent-host-death family protein